MPESRKTLEEAIETERARKPMWAEFISLSFQAEVEAGVRESVAATKWMAKITGRPE
jgi:hypothetical protein